MITAGAAPTPKPSINGVSHSDHPRSRPYKPTMPEPWSP